MPDGSFRVFVVGEQGQVARAVVRAFSAQGSAVCSAGRSTADIADRDAISQAIIAYRPNLVVNAAAYTAVDKAEDDQERAFQINRDGAGYVAAAARTAGAQLIHISTDYVFDGTKPSSYVETDKPNPIGVYGASKLAGEAAVMQEMPDPVILRASWVCSPDGTNFVKTMLGLAATRKEIGVVDDQYGAPTFAADLTEAIVAISKALTDTVDRTFLTGIFHATCSGETTWCRFARAIMAQSAEMGGPTCRVRAISTSEYPTRARRPVNSRLDCSKLDRVFGIRLPRWEVSLNACLNQLIPASGAVGT